MFPGIEDGAQENRVMNLELNIGVGILALAGSVVLTVLTTEYLWDALTNLTSE